MIDYAGNEEEIYSIVSETREDCLHVIDYGLFNRWEIYNGNDMLKYASDIEFNVGLKNGRNQMISGGFERDLIYCKLKCRGCSPDTVTADGKADRNFARFVQLRAKGL